MSPRFKYVAHRDSPNRKQNFTFDWIIPIIRHKKGLHGSQFKLTLTIQLLSISILLIKNLNKRPCLLIS